MFDGLKIHEKHGSQPMFKRVTVRLFSPNFTNTANTTTSDYLCLHLCAASHRLSPPFANPYQSGATTFTINITNTTASFVSAQLISMYLHKTLYLTKANVVCS
jgi:hypothetical protein